MPDTRERFAAQIWNRSAARPKNSRSFSNRIWKIRGDRESRGYQAEW
jgi:hypothetical protein